MAPIADRPFLEILLDYLIQQGIQSVTLCTGHLSKDIETHFGENYRSLSVSYSIETTPLGTGGAIKKALLSTREEHIVVLNGDSYYNVDLMKMMTRHVATDSTMTIALKEMKAFDRYGRVVFGADQQVRQFKEKKPSKSGWINGGVYIIKKTMLSTFPDEEVFSFETYMSELVKSGSIGAFLSDGYFIDIGIPEDYDRGQTTLPLISNRLFDGWTLFLDRDGVINERTPGDYIKSVDEWQYCNGALEAIALLSLIFDRIIVVTNQQGVPLGKMTSYTLDLIHQNLKDDVRKLGGHIDSIYASIDLKEKLNNSRKPNPSMGHWAKKDFPAIDFHKSIMVGDSASDIAFGQALGMRTASVDGKHEDTAEILALQPNWQFRDLSHFAESFRHPSKFYNQIESESSVE